MIGLVIFGVAIALFIVGLIVRWECGLRRAFREYRAPMIAALLIASATASAGAQAYGNRPDYNLGRKVCDNLNWPHHHFIVNCRPRWQQHVLLKAAPSAGIAYGVRKLTGLSPVKSSLVAVGVMNLGHAIGAARGTIKPTVDFAVDFHLSTLPLHWTAAKPGWGKVWAVVTWLAPYPLLAPYGSP